MITTTFEEQLARLIDLLPAHKNAVTLTELPIRFNWGTQDKLNEFMILPEGKSKYPLIWLVESKDSEDDQLETISRDNAKIIIATKTLGADRFNPEIYDTDYKDILNPIKNNLIKAMKASGISKLDPKYSVDRLKAYKWSENSNNNATSDIWNVIVIECKLLFENTERCLNKINF